MSTPAEVRSAASPAARGAFVRLLRSSAVYAVANFGIKALSFLLLPLYTRFLAPADYGVISLAETLAALIGIVGGLGLSSALGRLYFEYLDRPAELRAYVSSVLRFGVGMLAGVVALTMLAGPRLLALVPNLELKFFPYVTLAVTTAALLQLVDYRLTLFQVEQRPTAFAWFALASFGLTTVAAIALVVVVRWGAFGMLLGKALASAVVAALAIVLLWRWLWGGFRFAYVRESLRLALPIMPHSLMAIGLIAADRFILQSYRDLTEVGLYSIAYSFGMVMHLVTFSAQQAWGPGYFDLARGGEAAHNTLARISTALCLLLIAVAVFGALIAPDFVAWYLDPRYREAGRLVPWIIAGYCLHGLFAVFHLAGFQAKRSEFVLAASGVALGANLALNLALIPRWGMYGAAWATTAAYGLEALVMYGYAQRIFRLPYRRTAIVAGLAILGGALAVTQIPWPRGLHPLVMLATLVLSFLLLFLLGGRDAAESVKLVWRRLRLAAG